MPPCCTSTSSPRAWSRGRGRRATSARAPSSHAAMRSARSRRLPRQHALSVQVDTAHQGYLEPQVVVAQVDANGFATVWASTQGQFTAELMIAAHARPAAVEAQGRAAGDRRRLRRQDRHPRRGRGGAPGAEMPAARSSSCCTREEVLQGGSRPRRRRADRHRGRRRQGRPPRRHRRAPIAWMPAACRASALAA